MAYYLSKSNEAFLLQFIPLLKGSVNDVKLVTPNPERLEYILRSARGNPKYSWIGDKFTIRVREGYILCTIKVPNVEVPNQQIRTVESLSNFFDIANTLILEKPISIRYIYFDLSEEDITKLKVFCDNNNYKMEITDNQLTFTKN